MLKAEDTSVSSSVLDSLVLESSECVAEATNIDDVKPPPKRQRIESLRVGG